MTWMWEKVWLLTNTSTGAGHWRWDIRCGRERRFFGHATDEEMARFIVDALNEKEQREAMTPEERCVAADRERILGLLDG